jgi:ADP-heptose:LPS heptosyltransferase
LDGLISVKAQNKNPNTLLIVRLDSIGDYVIVRNFFLSLKQSDKYSGYKITLCGNIIWKDLAEAFDSKIFNNFIWVDRKKFNNNLFYKYNLLKNIYLTGFEVVIDTTFSREILFGDSIVNTSRAKTKIGSVGAPDFNSKHKRSLLTNKYYTRLIPQSEENILEFYRNQDFFSKVIEEKLTLTKPTIDVSGISLQLPTQNTFVVIFPGAQDSKRKWMHQNFIEVVKAIISKTTFDIIIAGSSNDRETAIAITSEINSAKLFDLTGETTLPQLAKLISQSKLLISNETGAVHIAAAVGTSFICISNGNHFGRFHPYPPEMNIKCRYFYPEEIEKNINDLTYLAKYRFKSNLNINSITPDKIINVLSNFL